MAISKITQTIEDGALGLSSGNGIDRHIAIGVASSGPENELEWHTDPVAVKARFGRGPIVDKAVYHLENTGGTVGLVRITASVAGSAGSVTVNRGGDGTSTATMTVSGAPNDSYEVIARMAEGGVNLAANTAAFVLSMDGGDTWTAPIAVPVSGVYAIPGTGLTMTWVNGAGPTSFIVGDTFSFDCTAPGFSTSNISDALDAVRADATARFRLIHLVGAAANAAGTASVAAAVATKMNTEAANYRYTYAVIEAADDTDANLKSAFANFVSERVCVVAGYCELFANKSQMKRSAAWPALARRMAQTPNRDLARTAPGSQGGALPGVVKLYRDEYLTPGLDDARFTTLRTHPGQPGFHVGNGRTMASLTSDFQLLQFRELMDVACTENYSALFPYLNDDLFDVDTETGFIDEVDARTVDSKTTALIRSAIVTNKWTTDASSRVVRDNNILSTMTLKTRVRIIPRGYAKHIETEIGFYNPALAAA